MPAPEVLTHRYQKFDFHWDCWYGGNRIGVKIQHILHMRNTHAMQTCNKSDCLRALKVVWVLNLKIEAFDFPPERRRVDAHLSGS
jgi:hypothetical protein